MVFGSFCCFSLVLSIFELVSSVFLLVFVSFWMVLGRFIGVFCNNWLQMATNWIFCEQFEQMASFGYN